MQELCAKMKEYLKMTDPLPYEQFVGYYQSVLDHLQEKYQDMTQDELVEAKTICNLLNANAVERAAKKDGNYKKFRKMAEKSAFWQDAIEVNLLKQGLTKKSLEEKEKEIWQTVFEPKEQTPEENLG